MHLGSTFHGLHAIATQIAPIVSQGIETLETDVFVLQCFQTLTGTKFVVTASPGTPDLDTFLKNVYDLYADYVLKVLNYFTIFTYIHFIMYFSLESVL